MKLAAAISLFLLTGAQAQFTLTIAHMNDHHSHVAEESIDIDASDLPEGLLPNGTEEVTVSYGGFPRLVSMYNSLEAENLLTLHAGDATVGTLYHKVSAGKADADMMNFICFDAMTLGNHEFDFGETFLSQFLTELQGGDCDEPTRVLSANFVSEESPILPFVTSSVEYEFGNEVVGVIGVTTETTATSSSPDMTSVFADIAATVEAEIADMPDVNKFVVLSHVGIELDVDVLATIPGVDIVVGGHSHSLLGEGFGLNADGPYPRLVGNACVVQAWEYGHGWGLLEVEFDDDGVVLNCTGGPKFPFDGTSYDPPLEEVVAANLTSFLESSGLYVAVEPDEDVADILAIWTNEVEVFGSEVLVFVPEGICFDRIPGQGRGEICSAEETSAQGGGACNIVAQSFMLEVPEADLAIQNGGGCRTDIFAGNFTVESAFAMLPFENTLVTIEMTGSQIIRVLNEALNSSAASGLSTGAYPYCSGLRFDVDITAGFGEFITDVEVNPQLGGEWEPIGMDASYTVVTNSFISAGRDGYLEFAAVAEANEDLVSDTYREYALTFIEWLQPLDNLTDLPPELYSTQSYQGTPAPTSMAPTEAPVMATPAPVSATTPAPVLAPVGDETMEPTSSAQSLVACGWIILAGAILFTGTPTW